jgi:hypothetical protein
MNKDFKWGKQDALEANLAWSAQPEYQEICKMLDEC